MPELIYLVDDFDITVDRILFDEELEGSGLTKKKVARSLRFFSGDEIACSVFLKKYALRDGEGQILELTLDESKDRWALEVAGSETKFTLSAEYVKDVAYFRELYNYFFPAGRQIFALGNQFIKKASYTNCYVTEIGEDSIEGIFDAAKGIARTYSYGGGIGLCMGKLRPCMAKVSNTARHSTGSVSFMRLFSLTTDLIGQEGRRGALMLTMPINHPDILDFIEIKHENKDSVRFANISVKITDAFMNAVINDTDFELLFETQHETIRKSVKARELWQKLIQSARDSAEPGLLFWDHITEDSPTDIYEQLKVVSTNPCITGDTLVYVADGRGHVPIKQLAEEGKDTPVFCLDNDKHTVVRYMRHPRITGYKQPVWKVTLDDGSTIRATANHKFVLSDGTIKCLSDLCENDSLKMLTKYAASIKDIFPGTHANATNYYWISCGFRSNIAEHRRIAEFFHNDDQPLKTGNVVHHKDYNGQNNAPNNLEVMSKTYHDKFHIRDKLGDANPVRRAKAEWSVAKWDTYSKHMSEATSGEKNGRWSGISNEELKKHALILTKQLGYRFSRSDWITYAKKENIVQAFSKWRNDHLNGVIGLAKWAALECGLDSIDLDPRMQRNYKSLLEQGYDCFMKAGEIWINKRCEICGNIFVVPSARRETGICSPECVGEFTRRRSATTENRERQRINSKKVWDERKRKNAEQQVVVFLDMCQRLGREPLRRELVVECKKRDLPYRLGRPSFFNTYKDLKDFAKNYNHRVVSVKFDGFEDVYNGTVDEYHNFFVGGFKGITKSGKDKYVYFNNLQCGELPLAKGGTCVLGSMLLHRFVKNPFTVEAEFDFTTFGEMVRRAVRHLDNVVELNFGRHPLSEQENGSRLSRRIGLGITGLADMLAALNLRYDSQEALDITARVMNVKMTKEYEASIDLARERGPFPLFNAQLHYERGFCARLPEDIKKLGRTYGQRNAGISTVAPNGSLSIIAQCSGGIEPIFALNYKRYVELGQDRKEFSICHPGVSRFKYVTKQDVLSDVWVSAHQIDCRYRIRMQGLVQKFVDASISSTINLPRDASAEMVGQIYIDAWREGLKGVTVYREGSREGILITDAYAQALHDAGLMDTVIQCVRAEGGDKFYIMTSYKDRDIKKPYQVFVMNYKQADRDSFIKISNSLIKMLKSKGVSDNRVNKYIERSKDSLAKLTRFLSLSMKTNNLESAVEILNEHAFAGTLASRLYEIFHRSLTIGKAICKNCQSSNVRMSEGCIICLDCNWSGCGG